GLARHVALPVLDGINGDVGRGDLGKAGRLGPVNGYLIVVFFEWIDNIRHNFVPPQQYQVVLWVIWVMRKTTNSAGRTGATPISQMSRPLRISSWVMVVAP